MDQNPPQAPQLTPPQPPEPPQPTEPYPHNDLPLQVPQPPAGPTPVVASPQPAWGAQSEQPQLQAAGQHRPHIKMPSFMQAATSAINGGAALSSFAAVPPAAASPAEPANLSSNDLNRPVPVVRVLSPVGVEYVFLTFTLLTGAVGLVSVLIALVNSKVDFDVLSFPAAVLIVSLPVFAKLFLRLKKQELLQPALKLDPSKRRSTQFTQIVSFVVCFFTLIGLVFAIFAKLGGDGDFSIVKAILDSLCVLVVAGGILAYYWRDEHKGY